MQMLAKDAQEEVYGDFEDLETGEKHAAAPGSGEAGAGVDGADESAGQKAPVKSKEQKRIEKKERLKAEFNASYDVGKA